MKNFAVILFLLSFFTTAAFAQPENKTARKMEESNIRITSTYSETTPLDLKKFKNLVPPSNKENEKGEVVVKVRIDHSGKVTWAMGDEERSTISNSVTYRQCERAIITSTFTQLKNGPFVDGGIVIFKFTN